MDLDDAIPVCHKCVLGATQCLTYGSCHARAQDYQGHLWEMWLAVVIDD